ncbi:MAG TPA: VOC family protein [Anaerolineaceae bacterium]|nr:VOC family protein [Anaerolineaceae bacterium]
MQIFAVSLLAEDLPAAVHFYRDVLGLRLLSHHGEKPHFDLGESYLVLLPGKPALSTERFPLVALRVDNLDEKVKVLEEHQVALPWGVETDGGSQWVMFHDPAGNLVELVELKMGEP